MPIKSKTLECHCKARVHEMEVIDQFQKYRRTLHAAVPICDMNKVRFQMHPRQLLEKVEFFKITRIHFLHYRRF